MWFGKRDSVLLPLITYSHFTMRDPVHTYMPKLTLQDDSSSKEICLPYKTENRPGIGRVLIATRTIKPMELVLIDPGTVTGPNYTTKPVCLECLRPVNG